MPRPFISNSSQPAGWRNPALWLYSLGILLVAASAAIFFSQDRTSELSCTNTEGICRLTRTSWFETQTTEFPISTVQRLDVKHARRRASLDFITTRGAIPFASDTGNPPAKSIADQFDKFKSGNGEPRLLARYEQLPEAIPHAAMFLVIGVVLLGAGWVQGWMAGKTAVRRR
jgi:hypothetical protein